jgi:biopolymer transport protein ExbB
MDEIIRLVALTGGLLAIMPVLLIITLAVSIERLWFLKRLLSQGRDVHARLRGVAYQNFAGLQAVEDKYPNTLQGRLISLAIVWSGTETADEMEMHLEEEILDAMPKITRGIWILDTSVTIAPLLGLFGTIIGMIQAFNVLAVNGGPSKVTGGIADALISTGAGLLIAIIAVYFVNYFNSLVRHVVHQLELIKLILINRTHATGENVGADKIVQSPTRFSTAGA